MTGDGWNLSQDRIMRGVLGNDHVECFKTLDQDIHDLGSNFQNVVVLQA